MRTQDSRVQIVTLVCAREDGALTRKQFPTPYLLSVALEMPAASAGAQNTLRPARPMLCY